MKQPPAWLLPFLLLAACASPPQFTVEPIDPAASLPVEYMAHLSTEALPSLDPDNAEVVLEDVTNEVNDSLGRPVDRADATALQELVEVACLLVELPRENAQQMLSRCESRLGANVTGREMAEGRFEELREHSLADMLYCPRLSLYHGQCGNLTTTNQTAYIDSFKLEVSGDGEVFVADPVVGVASDGLTIDLEIGTRTGDGPIPLDFTMTIAELQRPMIATEGRLPGTATPVTVQVPIYTMQRLHVAAELSADQALVIGAVPGRDPELAQLLLLTVDFYEIEDHDEVDETE